MTDWKRVRGSQEEKPAEFDTTSSEVVVYQRRNVERKPAQDMDGSTYEFWEYDERKMSHQEYAALQWAAIGAGLAAIEDALCEIDAGGDEEE